MIFYHSKASATSEQVRPVSETHSGHKGEYYLKHCQYPYKDAALFLTPVDPQTARPHRVDKQENTQTCHKNAVQQRTFEGIGVENAEKKPQCKPCAENLGKSQIFQVKAPPFAI